MTQEIPGITFAPVHFALVKKSNDDLIECGDTFESLKVDSETLSYVSQHTTEDDNIYHLLSTSTDSDLWIVIWERFQ